MGMAIFIKTLLSVAVFSYIGYIVQKESIGGKLFYSKWILILGFLSSIFVVVPIYVVMTGQTDGNTGTYIAIAFLIIGFGISSFACFAEYKITSGEYNQDGIHFCTPWSKCKEFKWSDIKKVTYSDTWHWYVYHTYDDKKMRFSSYLTGINQFIDYTNKKNIPFEV